MVVNASRRPTENTIEAIIIADGPLEDKGDEVDHRSPPSPDEGEGGMKDHTDWKIGKVVGASLRLKARNGAEWAAVPWLFVSLQQAHKHILPQRLEAHHFRMH